MNGVHPETSWKTTKWRDEAVKLTIYSVSSPVFDVQRVVSKGIGEFDRCATVEKKRRFMAQGSRFLLSVPSGWKDWRHDHPSRSCLHRRFKRSYSLSLRSTPFLSLILDLLNSIINYNATPLNSVDMTIDLSSRNSLVGDKLDDRSSMHGEGSTQSSLLEFLFTKSKTRGVQSRNGESRRSIYRRKYVMKLLIRVACELNRNSRRTKRRDD